MIQKKVLFLHYNFPAQFGPYMSFFYERDWSVAFAFCEAKSLHTTINFKVNKYHLTHSGKPSPNLQACLDISEVYLNFFFKLKKSGYYPDIIISHSGWGCGFYAKLLFPSCTLLSYSEWYHSVSHISQLSACDPIAFSGPVLRDYQKIPTRNVLALDELISADIVLSPTHFQRRQLPEVLQNKCVLLRDAVYTPSSFAYNYNIPATFSFVSRGIEPIRGSNYFLSLLPHLCSSPLVAQVNVVGASSSFYGAQNIKSSNTRQSLADLLKSNSSVNYYQNLPFVELLKLFSSSTAHLYLSLPFVPSWSMLNAMSVGLPVITFDLDYLSEFFPNNHLTIPIHASETEQKSKLFELISDAELMNKASNENRQYISTQHSYDLFVNSLKSLLA